MITGSLDGLQPGDPNDLKRALLRSETSGLLLTARDLPAFGATQHSNDLPLDPNSSQGALLLVNGRRSRL